MARDLGHCTGRATVGREEAVSDEVMGSAAHRSRWNALIADAPIESRVIELQRSVAQDLYTPHVFVPWDDVERSLVNYERAILGLQQLVDEDNRDTRLLAEWFEVPYSLAVVRALFAAPQPVGFVDGRVLPDVRPKDPGKRARLASLVVDLGLWRLLPSGARVDDLVRVGEVGLDARRRGFRRRDVVRTQLNTLIEAAVDEAALETGVAASVLPPAKWPLAARGRVTAVVAAGGVPVAGIVNVFQAQSGGRQQRDLQETYPALQRELDAVPMRLVLILDGAGVKEAPRRILARLLELVPASMSGAQAADGMLGAALAEAIGTRGATEPARRALEVLIANALNDGVSVTTEELPQGRDRVLLAFGEYLAAHPEEDLDLDLAAGRLAWRRPERALAVQTLTRAYGETEAVQMIADLLGMRDLGWLPASDGVTGAFGSLEDNVLPERMLVAAAPELTFDPDDELLRKVGRLNRSRDAGGGVALLAVPWSSGARPTAAQHRAMATSVVVVDIETLRRIATSKSPRDALVAVVLAQADLTKANPFTVMGATSRRMFYGRAAEEALLEHTLSSNSAALIGGRRIGKTSLLQHAQERLLDAGWNVWYADCQAVGSWEALTHHLRSHWDVELVPEFSIAAVADLFTALAARKNGPLVVMLDEIDNLLRWDRDVNHADGMREPLFRALRGLSQEGKAQFVFSGERLIASVLWDPSSPHWNFCRAVPLRQLTRTDADALLYEPLRSLGIRLQDPAAVLDRSWRATSGHPQIVQQLGESLVQSLNSRPAEDRVSVGISDVDAVVSDTLFKRHYVSTYWGQATPSEKLITALAAGGVDTLDGVASAFADLGVQYTLDGLRAALRMLDLYGIINADRAKFEWRAVAFPSALEAVGGAELLVDDLQRQIGDDSGRSR